MFVFRAVIFLEPTRIVLLEVNRKAVIRVYHNQIPHSTLKTKRKRSTQTTFTFIDKRSPLVLGTKIAG